MKNNDSGRIFFNYISNNACKKCTFNDIIKEKEFCHEKNKNFLAAAFFALFAFGFLFSTGINVTKINALSPLLFQNGKAEHTTVYYFSDSEPSFLDELDAMGYPAPVVDVRNLLSEQELRYLIFSGYFWGFQSSENADENTFNHIAVIEIKTFKPSVATITNLVNCLTYQHVSVIFVSPFYEDYNIYNCYTTPCDFDQYTVYLRNTIRYMDYDIDGDSTTILLSDDFLADLNNSVNTEDIDQILLSSVILRRMLCYYYYGIDLDDGIKYEKEIYSNMWTSFFNIDFVRGRFAFDDFNFFENDEYIIEIALFEDLWNYVTDEENQNGQPFYNPISIVSRPDLKLNMLEYYKKICVTGFDVASSDEGESLPSLVCKNFFVYVQVSENSFLDLTYVPFSIKLLEIIDMHDVICDDDNEVPSNRFYALGTWTLNSEFNNILLSHWQDVDLGSAQPIGCNGMVMVFKVFLYEKDPIEVSVNGYTAITDSGLIGLLGSEFDDYPNAGVLFLDLFTALFNQLTVI